jgi:hypothetical protein
MLIFRGKGLRIKESERAAWDKRVCVKFQAKAWFDRPVAKYYSHEVWQELLDADKAAGVANEDTKYVTFLDRLDAQDTPQFKADMKERQSFIYTLPTGHTDDFQPVDRGFGQTVKRYVGDALEDWLLSDDNLHQWEDGVIDTSQRRILLSHWVGDAFERAIKGDTKRTYFEQTGLAMDLNGKCALRLDGDPAGVDYAWQDESLLDLTNTYSNAAPPPLVDEPDSDDEVDWGAGDEERRLVDISDSDDEDEDIGEQPFEAPAGWTISEEEPVATQLKYGCAAGKAWIGRRVLLTWKARFAVREQARAVSARRAAVRPTSLSTMRRVKWKSCMTFSSPVGLVLSISDCRVLLDREQTM